MHVSWEFSAANRMDNNATKTKNGNRHSGNTTQGNNGNNFNTVLLLYCVISLLTIIMVLLLIILLKKYCKKCNGNMSDSNVEEGTFRMSVIRCNPDLDNPNNDAANYLNNSQTYTACNNDSFSTSWDSSCPSNEDKQKTDKQQYMSLKNSHQGPDYENIPEGKSTSAHNYEKKKAKKNRDYVNIKEQQCIPPTNGRKSKCKRDQGDEDESQTSGESSSEASDDNSVDYTTVVFK